MFKLTMYSRNNTFSVIQHFPEADFRKDKSITSVKSLMRHWLCRFKADYVDQRKVRIQKPRRNKPSLNSFVLLLRVDARPAAMAFPSV